MTRPLQPCGTKSAYRRHLYHKEDPCAKCKAANTAKQNPNGPTAMRVGEVHWDEVLQSNPPDIGWVKNSHGVWVHTYINDPHAEREPADRKPRGLRDIDIEYLEEIS